MSPTNNLIKAAKHLHCNYGIGDIDEVRIYASGRVEVYATGYGMRQHIRRGRVKGSTVLLYGHSKTIR